MAKSKNNDINAQIFYALKVSEESRVPFLFMSAPGMGKSTSVDMFAKIRGYELEVLRGNSTSESEVMGYDVVDTTPGSKSTIHLRPSWYNKVLENASNGKRTLLFLDEITTCPEHVQSALLHLIFERKVGDENIPEDTLIVSAGNYSQSLGNTFGLIPPLMNRFCIFNIVPEKEDVKSFLCRYEGAIAGNMVDFMTAKTAQLKAMDSQEKPMDPDTKNKISEYIERGVYETTKLLMTTGERVVDLKVTDMQGIYTETDNDATLKGFVTMRTLNYLRDVSIAAWKCFGKNGIVSDNYRNMIEGLCGIGLSRGKNREVVTTIVTKDYYDSMCSVVADIDKMKNTKLPEYENFFNTIVGAKDKTSLTPEEINVVNNKVTELKSDVELKDIDRPIDSEIIEKLCGIIVYNSKDTTKIKITSSDKLTDKVSPEALAGYVTRWNSLADLLKNIGTLVQDSGRNYKDSTKATINKTIEDIKKDSFKLKSLFRLISVEAPAAVSIIPELHTDYVK